MRRIILALILAVGMSGVAGAAVNNIQVSGDVITQAITRDLSLDGESGNLDQEDFILSQIQLRFDADLTENVSAVVQVLNERLWGAENEVNNLGTSTNDTDDTDTSLDLDLAYVKMEDMFQAPITVKLGRQNLRFGRGLIVGDPDTDNQVSSASGLYQTAGDLSLRKSFDALRVTMDYNPVIVDLIYAKIQENNTNVRDDQNLYGFNAAYDINADTTGELYLFAKDANIIPESGNADSDDAVYTVGTRMESTAIDNWLLFGELAYQFGDYVNVDSTTDNDIEAYAAQLGSTFMFGDEADSQIGLEATYLSGDDDSTDSDYEAWDPMFEDQRVGEIANLIFDNTNMWYIKTSASTNLIEDLKLQGDVYYLELAEELTSDSLINDDELEMNSGDTSNAYSVKSGEDEIGWETDVSLMYDYTEDVQMGLVSGFFFPGDLFQDSNDSTAYSVRATASVQF